MATKIKRISVQNLKAVTEFTADFNGCTAIVTAGNNKGKTSFLKSLSDRLQGIKPDRILKQGEQNGFYEMELTTGEKFVWSFDAKTKAGEKLTFISEKNIPQSVTRELSKYYFPEVFNVDEFLLAAPKKQKEILQKLTGIDFTEIDNLYKEAYDQRTFANKVLAEEKAKAMFIDPTLPKEPESTELLESELHGIDAHNLRYANIQDRVKEKKELLDKNAAEILRLQALIDDLKCSNDGLSKDIQAGNEWMALEKNKPKENQQELRDKIQAVKDRNKAIEENNKAIEQDDRINKASERAKEADAEVKRIENEKLDVIKNASMPDGFGFSEDGITYNGFAFNRETLSSSGIYIAALKLAALTLGEVKSLHFDASYLDKNSLAEIEKWANENDLQLLIERPDFDAGEIRYEIVQCVNA